MEFDIRMTVVVQSFSVTEQCDANIRLEIHFWLNTK